MNVGLDIALPNIRGINHMHCLVRRPKVQIINQTVPGYSFVTTCMATTTQMPCRKAIRIQITTD
jgi:hypothetical protein